MSYTFLQYQQEGASYLNSPDDPEILGVAGSGVNSAINRLNGFNWSWLVATSGFGFVAGQTDYTIPSGVKTVRALRIPSDSRIGFKDRETFNTEHPDYQASGDPHFYTFINTFPTQKIRLSNAPGVNWISSHTSGTLEYYGRITNLTTNGQQLNLMPEIEEMLMDYVRMWTAARYDKDDKTARYRAAKSDYDAGFQRIYSNEMNDQVQDQE